jgi:molybdenum cofactor synthesis domain-containing protein
MMRAQMPPAEHERPTAAVLLIGDELLSGKIRDENGYFLATALRARGVRLLEICTVPDDFDRIGHALLRLLSQTPVLFTSGGVGPTHDDLTMEAIARATDRPLERNHDLASMLRTFYGERLTDEALSMADLPRGTTMLAPGGWPVMRLNLPATFAAPDSPEADQDRRIYILPGVPPLLRKKFEIMAGLEGELPSGRPWVLRDLWLACDESALAAALNQVNADFPDVTIGSYPRWERDSQGKQHIKLRLTFEADDPELVDSAREAVRAAAPEGTEIPPET